MMALTLIVGALIGVAVGALVGWSAAFVHIERERSRGRSFDDIIEGQR